MLPAQGQTLAQAWAQVELALTQANLSFGHGTTNARDEAAWLVLAAAGLPIDAMEAQFESVLSEAQSAAITQLTAQRIATRKPLAYLTRQAWLQGVEFYCDERAIVPRSLIAECIAEASFDAYFSRQPEAMLDMCTGNGSLAVLLALAYQAPRVIGADISSAALEVAQINLAKHSLQAAVELRESNGFSGLAGEAFDLIVCNPPYVNSQSMASLPQEYRAEPDLALAGGQDGMDFIRNFLREAPKYLLANGFVVLEIGNEKNYFDAAFPNLNPIWLDTSAGDEQVCLLLRDDLLSLS